MSQNFRLRFARDLLIPVHKHFADICQEACRAIFSRRELEQLRVVIQKSCGCSTRLELLVVNNVFKERDVGDDAANTEFAERAIHPVTSFDEIVSPGSD